MPQHGFSETLNSQLRWTPTPPTLNYQTGQGRRESNKRFPAKEELEPPMKMHRRIKKV